MNDQHIPSPTEIAPEGFRGRIVGVTRIGGKAGFVAAFVGAMLTALIVYGISTSGHHHRLAGMDGPPLTKASEQHEEWWASVPDGPGTPPALPTPEPLRHHVRKYPHVTEPEKSIVREQVPEIAPLPPIVAPIREAMPIERDPEEERHRALREAALGAPVAVRLDEHPGASEIEESLRALGNAAGAPITPATTETSLGNGGQDERIGFLAQERQAVSSSRDWLPSVRRLAVSPFTLRAGSVIPAMLLTGINADLPGTLIAQVRTDVFDSVSGRALLIPDGARLIGTYDSHVVQGQKRMLVVWQRLLYPDGSDLDLRGMPGVDSAGYAGLAASADEHLGKTIGSTALLSVISAGAQLGQPQRSAVVGGVPDVGQVVAGALGQQIANENLQLAQRQMQTSPTLIVEPGYRFNVLVDRDIVLAVAYAAGNAAP